MTKSRLTLRELAHDLDCNTNRVSSWDLRNAVDDVVRLAQLPLGIRTRLANDLAAVARDLDDVLYRMELLSFVVSQLGRVADGVDDGTAFVDNYLRGA